MWVHERTVLTMVAQRMEDAMRDAEHARALRKARRSSRVRFGALLVRLGRRIMGEDAVSPGLSTAHD